MYQNVDPYNSHAIVCIVCSFSLFVGMTAGSECGDDEP